MCCDLVFTITPILSPYVHLHLAEILARSLPIAPSTFVKSYSGMNLHRTATLDGCHTHQ
jgi:hypothetical protein